MMDSLGLALENYHPSAPFVPRRMAAPLMYRRIIGTDVDGSFVGPVALAQKLGSSQQANLCLAKNWLTFAYGRAITSDEACTQALVQRTYEASGYNVRALLLALTQTDAFLYRTAPQP